MPLLFFYILAFRTGIEYLVPFFIYPVINIWNGYISAAGGGFGALHLIMIPQTDVLVHIIYHINVVLKSFRICLVISGLAQNKYICVNMNVFI